MTILILASASQARANILNGAGIAFEAISANIDEAAIKRRCADQPPDQIAIEIATAKALKIAQSQPDGMVVGSDQVLVHRGRLYSKPRDLVEARSHLSALSGETHHLMAAAALVRDDNVLWTGAQQVALKMRPLSEKFIDDYLAKLGTLALNSVGCYHLEGLGAQLFTEVDGDYFAVLGIPLLPLLQALRNHGCLPE